MYDNIFNNFNKPQNYRPFTTQTTCYTKSEAFKTSSRYKPESSKFNGFPTEKKIKVNIKKMLLVYKTKEYNILHKTKPKISNTSPTLFQGQLERKNFTALT